MPRPSGRHTSRAAGADRPSVSDLTPHAVNLEAGKTLVSRRKFLYGAVGVGAVAAVGAGVAAVAARSGNNDEVAYLEVPESSVTALTEMTNIEDYESRVQLVSTNDLPYGTLVWANCDEVAACLVPTDTGSPLVNVALLQLGSGTFTTVINKAAGAVEGFEIYDVRALPQGLVWTEANVLEGTWRIYTAHNTNGTVGEPVLADSGDSTYDTPMLTVAGNYAFWQLLPKLPNDAGLPSYLKRVRFGSSETETVLENARRMATPPYSSGDAVVVTPRLDMGTVYYQLTCIDAESLAIRDTLTLPSGMKPLEAGYGKTGFSFAFDSIYNYGGGIANLGTYTPKAKVSPGGDYSASRWFSFTRTPFTSPAWANDSFIVKSTRAVCGVDLERDEYFAIDVDDGADNYGEFLASTGVNETFVTFTNVDHTPVEGTATKACRVKVWRPLARTEIAQYDDGGDEESDELDVSDDSSSSSEASTVST